MPVFLTVEEVTRLNAETINQQGGTFGVLNAGSLESAVMLPQQQMFGQYLHPTLEQQAGAYMFHICQNHAFEDGNKRTALLAGETFLQMNGKELTLSQTEKVDLMWSVADGRTSKEELLKSLEGRTKDVELKEQQELKQAEAKAQQEKAEKEALEKEQAQKEKEQQEKEKLQEEKQKAKEQELKEKEQVKAEVEKKAQEQQEKEAQQQQAKEAEEQKKQAQAERQKQENTEPKEAPETTRNIYKDPELSVDVKSNDTFQFTLQDNRTFTMQRDGMAHEETLRDNLADIRFRNGLISDLKNLQEGETLKIDKYNKPIEIPPPPPPPLEPSF